MSLKSDKMKPRELNNDQFHLEEESNLEDTLRDMYLTFLLADEEYGVPVKFITELIGIQHITKLPKVEHYIKGIINLRGSIIPVIDVRLKFHKEEKPYDNLTCIVVLDYQGTSLGLIVDKVSEVTSIPSENILPPPSAKFGYRNHYVKNIAKLIDEVVMILDLQKLLYVDK